MAWIQHPVRLEGSLVRLEPLEYTHIPALVGAGSDPQIWSFLPIDGARPGALEAELKAAVLKRRSGEQYPFTIIRQSDDAPVGSTRLFDIFPDHRKLEIGWTWLAPVAWGSGINAEAKLQLLGYCFDMLKTVRVQLKTRDANARSAAAIRGIGATFEGTLRKDRIGPDGTVRDSLVFSVVDDEWPAVRAGLEARVAQCAARTA